MGGLTDGEHTEALSTGGKQPADDSVCVAVHIRPLIANELAEGCQTCLTVAPGQPQVFSGASSFTYDHVFGGGGVPEENLYTNCVEPLVEGLFKGYNATTFAYGQTGSGKTWTMGSAFTPGGGSRGVIPKVMDTIFSKIEGTQGTDFTVRVGFVEIHTEEIRDLLLADAAGGQSVHIREVPGGGICLAGATEKEVASKAQMADLLCQGTMQRQTASTSMNKHSSRSHAIFTITVEQRRQLQTASTSRRESQAEDEEEADESADEMVDEYLCAKMHLVDLAGSERLKRTKADGQRLKEGININKGLLALGNVICALSEGKSHVPYRDSKLTRMLQDSLGGNSRTLMIACVSPADVNLEESMNTLRYANRARNIKNKPVVNRDPNAAQVAHLRQQLAAAKAENNMLRGMIKSRPAEGGAEVGWTDPAGLGGTSFMAAALDESELKASKLDLDNARLRVDLEASRQETRELAAKLVRCQAERDGNALRLEQLAPGASQGSSEEGLVQMGIMQQHLQRIADLEGEVKRLKKVQRASGAYMMSTRKQGKGLASMHSQELPPSPLPMADLDSVVLQLDAGCGEDGGSSLAEDEEYAAEEHAHRVEQQKVAGELEKLQQVLESKEAQMARVLNGDGQIASLKGHYDRMLTELQSERDELKKERVDLLQRMQSLRSMKEEDRTAMEARYKQRLKEMDGKLKDVGKRERKYAQVERLQAKSQETCQRLQNDILAIKQQKVQLTRQMERSHKEFQQWRKQREQELMRLRRQGMKAAAHVQRLEALQSKQQAVLRRKTEEAEAARKRLKEMVEVHQRAGETRSQRSQQQPRNNGAEAQPNNSAPLLRDEKSRQHWVEHELDMCCQSFELQRVVEGEKAERTETARQLQEAKRRLATAPPGRQTEVLVAKSAALQEKLREQSAQILETQQQLMKVKAEEEQKTQAAGDARRWNGLKTMVEARALLKSLFKVATNQKAQVYEVQGEASEAREEVELLRLKLEGALQEAEEARQAAAAAQSALAAGLAAQAAAGTPTDSPATAPPPDELGEEVESLLEAISGAEQAVQAPGSPAAASEAEEHDVSGTESEGLEDEEDEEEEEDGEESEEEADDVWDPQHATPWKPRVSRRRSGNPTARPISATSTLRSSAEEAEEELKTMRNEVEYPVLMDINDDRTRQGLSPVVKLTVPVLKRHLKGKQIGGQEWRMGNKKREDLIEDYRDMLGVKNRVRAPLTLRANPLPDFEPNRPSDSRASGQESPAASRPPAQPGSPFRAPRPGIGQHVLGSRPDSLPIKARDSPTGSPATSHGLRSEASQASSPGDVKRELSGRLSPAPSEQNTENVFAGNTPSPIHASLARLRMAPVPATPAASGGTSAAAGAAAIDQDASPSARFYRDSEPRIAAELEKIEAKKRDFKRMKKRMGLPTASPQYRPPPSEEEVAAMVDDKGITQNINEPSRARSEANTRRYYDWRATADYYEPPPKLKAARPTARGDAPGRPQGSAPANVAPSWGFDARGPSNIPAVPPAASAAEPAAAGKAGLRTAPAVVPALQLPRREAEGQLPHVAAPVMPEPQQHLSPVRARSPAALRENPCVDGEPYQPGSPTRHILGDIANSRDSLSPFSRRSVEKLGAETATSRLRRSQPNLGSLCGNGGSLSARGPARSSLISPRPRAAWL